MKIIIKMLALFFIIFWSINILVAENNQKIKVMTLGCFHFSFPNLDAVKTAEENQISVLDEPYQSEIIAIAEALSNFKPDIIAIEVLPENQKRIDELYNLYKNNQFTLPTGEHYQLGFRIGKMNNVPKIYCVDDFGRAYENVQELWADSLRLKNFSDYFDEVNKNVSMEAEKVNSVLSELIKKNQPDYVKNRLSVYLKGLFNYEEKDGDFLGVDFETGRWFNRNLRIFRNIQRIETSPDSRILLIVGAEHLNLINFFLDVSDEFEFVSPLPYLERMK